MPSEDNLRLTAMLAEYQKLNAEIQNRSAAQHLIVQIHVAVLTVIFGVIASGKFLPWVLFAIPITSAIFGVFYLDHAITITRVGSYIQMKIEREVNALLGGESILEWESGTAKLPQTMRRHLDIFGRLIGVIFLGPCALLWFVCASLLVTVLPNVRGGLNDFIAAHAGSQIPVFYPGLTWILGLLLLLISLYFMVNYILYAREASRYSKERGQIAQLYLGNQRQEETEKSA